jgi:SAM-dependent methyltransferase
MTYALPAINPFLASRFKRIAPAPRPQPAPPPERRSDPEQPVYARLPRAPRYASPVPQLTSLYHNAEAGPYGDRGYPGNCSGNLIRDLLLFFKPDGLILDPMAGSGTCGDVCRELGVPCMSWDIHQGIDACDPAGFGPEASFAFIWSHPAYWRQKLYADDPRDLSRAPTLERFLQRYEQFIRNCAHALKPGGKLVILMGDYSDREAGFVPLTYHSKRLAFAAGLKQHCTDIIRWSHGASSSRKVYRSSFIPGLHDVCMIFEKTA